MLRAIILFVYVLLAFMIVGLVLLQRGKGADAGAGFGAGASGTVFGARGSTTLFSRLTAIFAALFFALSLGLTYLGTKQPAEPTTVLERAAQSTPSAPAAPAPAAQAPTPAAPAAATMPAAPAPAPASKP
jgi:preprotein translocase subunit SecG